MIFMWHWPISCPNRPDFNKTLYCIFSMHYVQVSVLSGDYFHPTGTFSTLPTPPHYHHLLHPTNIFILLSPPPPYQHLFSSTVTSSTLPSPTLPFHHLLHTITPSTLASSPPYQHLPHPTTITSSTLPTPPPPYQHLHLTTITCSTLAIITTPLPLLPPSHLLIKSRPLPLIEILFGQLFGRHFRVTDCGRVCSTE